MEIFLFWLGLSILAGVIAAGKGRSGLGFFLLAVFLSPLIGLIAALCVRPREVLDAQRARASGVYGGWRRCPHCAEAVRIEARVCRYCGNDLPEPAQRSVAEVFGQIAGEWVRAKRGSR